MWAGNSGTEPAAGSGTCGSAALSSSASLGSYHKSYSYTHLGQLWQVNGGGSHLQYLYCNSSAPHQLSAIVPTTGSCSNQSGATYSSSYDAWGNVTSRTSGGNTAALSYDLLDNFVQWSSGSSNKEWYVYDASGNRVLRRSQTSTGTTVTVYAFGLEEHTYTFDGSGNPTGQNQTYYYSLGGSLLGAFEVNGSASTTNYFLSDSLGSVLATITNTASSASVQGNQLYDPYGSSRYQSGSMTTSKGFTGQYNDNLTGLDYYGSRYYDPAAGVFLSADPVVGDLAGANPYEYVNANPETNTDPSGQRVISPGGQQGPLGPINVDNVPPAWIQDMQSNAAGVLRNVKDLNLQPDACNAGCKTVLAALVPHDLPGGGPGSFAGGGRCLASPGFISAGPLGAVLVGSPGGGCIPGGGNAEPPSSSPSSRPSITFWQVVPYTLCTGGYDCSDENGGKNKSGEPGGARESGNLLAADAGEEGNVGNVGGDQAPPETPTARPVNKNGDPYPNVIDPRTGNPMPFPEGQLQWVSAVDRVEWTNETRGAFIKEWIEGGYPDYGKEGWRALDIHHILPREYGGTNDFWNLIPVDRSVHQGPAPDGITSWWNAFEP